MIFETVLAQPGLCDRFVVICSGGEETYDVSLIEPLVNCFTGTRDFFGNFHFPWFFIQNVFADHAIYVDDVVLPPA